VEGAAETEVGILGPLVVPVHGTSLAPSAAKPRQVLALRASNLGLHVSVGTIVQELWGDANPGCPVRRALIAYAPTARR
jgi:hypothetical protein